MSKEISYKTKQSREALVVELKDYDIEKTSFEGHTMSRCTVTYTCKYGHTSQPIRYDWLRTTMDEVKYGKEGKKRKCLCGTCLDIYNKNKRFKECQHLVSKYMPEFELDENITNNSRGGINLKITCPHGHVTGKLKTVFKANDGYRCVECTKEFVKNSDELYCPGCDMSLNKTLFNLCKSNAHKDGHDHYCRECRHKQSIVRKQKKEAREKEKLEASDQEDTESEEELFS